PPELTQLVQLGNRQLRQELVPVDLQTWPVHRHGPTSVPPGRLSPVASLQMGPLRARSAPALREDAPQAPRLRGDPPPPSFLRAMLTPPSPPPGPAAGRPGPAAHDP